eukprot:g2275.t1
MEDILGDGSVLKSVVEEGDDPPVYPIFGDECITHFVGTLPDGKIFNDTMKRDQPFKFALGAQEVLEGFDEGVATMRQGERAVLHLTPEVAYGALGARDEAGWQVPPDTAVTFDVRLLQVIKTATPGSDGQSEASRGFGRQDVGKGGQDIAYRWERKGAEVLVIVPVQENIQLKDVSHSFQEKKVVLQVQQEVILEGIPGCDLEPEECYWEFETDPAGRKSWCGGVVAWAQAYRHPVRVHAEVAQPIPEPGAAEGGSPLAFRRRR